MILNKYLGRLFRKVPIATPHTLSTDEKLTNLPVRHFFIILINDIYKHIGIRFANGDILITGNHLHRTANRCFCRPISVHDICFRIDFT